MDVRVAAPADAPGVARVHVLAWQVAYRGLLPEDYLDALRPEDRAPHYRFEAPRPAQATTFVAVAGHDVVGFATIGSPPSPRIGELAALYVDPGWWRRGIGRTLIERVRTAMADGGCRAARLWVLLGNSRAERFYEADGWRPDGSSRRYAAWGVTVNEVGYQRSLP